MKTILIILFCSISLLGYSQTKDYYKKDGEIATSKTKSGSSDVFVCERGNYTSIIYNKKNKLKPVSKYKDGSALPGDVLVHIILVDPAIIHKIASSLLKKYSLEIYDYGTDRSAIKDKTNSLYFYIYHDSETGDVLEVEFDLSPTNDDYASHLPIDFYLEFEKRIKKEVKGIVTEEGKRRFYCIYWAPIYFKPKAS